MKDDQKTFADYDINQGIVDALDAQEITVPFPIQALTLPVALDGRDIIGQAKTGTGKTLGFGIPLLEKIVGHTDPDFEALPKPGAPQALVVLPTRELCRQVGEDLRAAAVNLPVRITDIYGGVDFEPQLKALRDGVEVVVGTPGRLLDLANRRALDLSHVKVVVLDEADEMLDLGFLPDVDKLMSQVSPSRQTMLFSATIPGPVVTLARRYMVQPTHIRAHDPTSPEQTVKNVSQHAYRTHPMNKAEVLSRILQAEGRGRTIVFVRTKRGVDNLEQDLRGRGFNVRALHGDLGQGARERSMQSLRDGKIDVLVATDVAARGLDVEDVTHVINYSVPEDDKVYLHRVGRTARAGAKGTAITFVEWDEVPRWGLISNALDLDLVDPPETYHTSEHLFEDLDIDPEVTGRLKGAPKQAARERGRGRSGGRQGGRGRQDRNRGRGGQRGRRKSGQAQRSSDGGARRRRRAGGDGSAPNQTKGADKPKRNEKSAQSNTEKPRRRIRKYRGNRATGDQSEGK